MARSKKRQSEDEVWTAPTVQYLGSRRREDGLWESIEIDENQPPASEVFSVSAKPTGEKDFCLSSPTRSHHRNLRSTGTQTSCPDTPPPPAPATIPPKSPTTSAHSRATTPKIADMIARVLHCPLPHTGVNDLAAAATRPPAPVPPSSAKRRPGRPRNSVGFRNVPRSMRFSDPAPSEGSRPRDSHVFVRLLHVRVARDASGEGGAGGGEGGARRLWQLLSWNKRGKGWSEARRSDETFAELASLFDLVPGAAELAIRAVVLPTEGGGVRQPVEVVWDVGRFCFLGVNNEGETLSVTLGEMREMARDPWARQFVAYMLG